MSSLRQIEANRRNALKSTGPTSPEGKERSRCNALRHGLTAETVIAGLEDAEDYQAFEASITADYDAQTAVERELVLRLSSLLWRLRRASGIETALFASVAAEPPAPSNERVQLTVIGGTEPGSHDGGSLGDEARGRYGSAENEIAACFMRLMSQPTFALDRLSRYEHILWRQARQISFALECLRRRERPFRRPGFPFSLGSCRESLLDGRQRQPTDRP